MRFVQLLYISGTIMFFAACRNSADELPFIGSQSYPLNQVSVEKSFSGRYLAESSDSSTEADFQDRRLAELVLLSKKLRETKSDSIWMLFRQKWTSYSASGILDSSAGNSVQRLKKWAGLNSDILKLTGEVRFADALEKLVDQPKPVVDEAFFKSVIYTHNFDQIYVNLLAPSTLNHVHTTGGNVRLIQENFSSDRNELNLKFESGDLRYLDVFIRIPGWAEKPSVTLGNVKYVARPGEYCQISRKWKGGDALLIRLKN